MYDADDLLFEYTMNSNPKSNDDLKRYLRRYPQFREEIIEFTANWRALSIVEKMLPPLLPDPVLERQMLRRAERQLRAVQQRRTGDNPNLKDCPGRATNETAKRNRQQENSSARAVWSTTNDAVSRRQR